MMWCLLVCRVELLIQCDAGTYQLQSGQGEFAIQDPDCASSHCQVIQQPVLATVQVVSVMMSLMICTCMCMHVCAEMYAVIDMRSGNGQQLQALKFSAVP